MNGDDEAWSADAAMARIDAGVKRSWLATWEEGCDDDDDDVEGEGEDEDESDGEDADEAEEEADGCRSRSKRRRLVARMLSAVTDAVSRDHRRHRRSTQI
jgi:TATA-binding protein-associated factor Taf7